MNQEAAGLLLIDKPAGLTSHDVVDVCRRAYGQRSVGHLGTLDPFATGLLVLLFGRATRLATFIVAEPKVYQATICFGTETDTDDVTGAPIRAAAAPSADAIANAMVALTGPLDQTPPAYSAKHMPGGGRAYTAARRGEAVVLPPVRVTVHGWELLALSAETADVCITCSTGTYVRALARDLGRHAGSAAHLAVLRRTQVGAFSIERAFPLAAVAATETVPPPLRPLRIVADD